MKVWLVGCGTMAVDYHKVLQSLGAELTVIGRGERSALQFESQTSQPVVRGGLEDFLLSAPALPEAAVVSVGIEALAPVSIALIEAGVRKLLVEKPGALNTAEIERVRDIAHAVGAQVLLAYNRRFYSAALHAKRMIAEDGGPLSCHFEFTEWSHEIEALDKHPDIKTRWFLGNSTHVVDLAFHLAGSPTAMSTYTAGSTPWHPSSSIFAGAGTTDRGALFSYQANWGAPGRWGVEIMTPVYRFVFRPMEILQLMRSKSVRVEPVEIDDSLDKRFKPGLYEQVRRFLDGEYADFCTIDEQVRHWSYYCRMAAYHAQAAVAGNG